MIGPLVAEHCSEGHVHAAVDVEQPMVVVVVAGRPTIAVTMHWSTALTSATHLVRAALAAATAVDGGITSDEWTTAVRQVLEATHP